MQLEPNAVIAVDVVLFTVRVDEPSHRAWQVLLVQSEDRSLAGKWRFPGVLVGAEETFDEAARRALQRKAGLDAAHWYLEQLGTFGAPDRDTRGRVSSSLRSSARCATETTRPRVSRSGAPKVPSCSRYQ